MNEYINSEILCQRMKKQNVTISSLADAMAMSRQSVSHVLHGKNHPSLYMIRLIVERLQLSVGKFLLKEVLKCRHNSVYIAIAAISRKGAFYMDQEQLYQQYHKLLHFILSRHHLSPTHAHYADLYQELYVQLVSVAHIFDGDPFKDCYRFTAYAKTRLNWWLKDYFKKQKATTCPLESKDEPVTYMDTHQAEQFMAMAQQLLTTEEYQFLTYVLEDGITAAEKAERLGISRKTYYQRKQKLAKKLHQLHDVLAK